MSGELERRVILGVFVAYMAAFAVVTVVLMPFIGSRSGLWSRPSSERSLSEKHWDTLGFVFSGRHRERGDRMLTVLVLIARAVYLLGPVLLLAFYGYGLVKEIVRGK